MLRSLSIRMRLALMVAIGVFGLIALGAFELLTSRQTMVEDREREVRTLVEVAIGTIAGHHALVATGELSEAEAQHLAMESLRTALYGADDYFFITDTANIMLMHPLNRDLEGRDLTGLQDPDGVAIVADLQRAAGAGGGFVNYRWDRAGDGTLVPKISYGARFQPWGWMIVTGVYVDDIDAAFWAKTQSAGLIILLIAAVSAGIGQAVSFSIASGIGRITDTMHRLAGGETDVRVPDLAVKNEIGRMAAAVEVFRVNAEEKAALEARQHEAEEKAAAEKRAMLNRLADDFEASVGEIVQSVAAAAQEMQASAHAMAEIAEETSRQSTTVSSAAEESSTSVQTVAAATEELGSSIGEISRQMSEQTGAAAAAVDAAESSHKEINGLADQVTAISGVVSLITAIAEQTNLLALNATIEAARAGDAGKGFAVVASEVKNLASQTAKATDEIAGQIQGVQSQTALAVDAIADINEKIGRIREISTSVAAAVDEQTAVATEIGSNTNQVAVGTAQVTSSISGVREASSQAGESASTVLDAAAELSQQSQQLSTQVSTFMQRVRSA